MSSAAELKGWTVADLRTLARERGVPSVGLLKSELVDALAPGIRLSSATPRRSVGSRSTEAAPTLRRSARLAGTGYAEEGTAVELVPPTRAPRSATHDTYKATEEGSFWMTTSAEPAPTARRPTSRYSSSADVPPAASRSARRASEITTGAVARGAAQDEPVEASGLWTTAYYAPAVAAPRSAARPFSLVDPTDVAPTSERRTSALAREPLSLPPPPPPSSSTRRSSSSSPSQALLSSSQPQPSLPRAAVATRRLSSPLPIPLTPSTVLEQPRPLPPPPRLSSSGRPLSLSSSPLRPPSSSPSQTTPTPPHQQQQQQQQQLLSTPVSVTQRPLSLEPPPLPRSSPPPLPRSSPPPLPRSSPPPLPSSPSQTSSPPPYQPQQPLSTPGSGTRRLSSLGPAPVPASATLQQPQPVPTPRLPSSLDTTRRASSPSLPRFSTSPSKLSPPHQPQQLGPTPTISATTTRRLSSLPPPPLLPQAPSHRPQQPSLPPPPPPPPMTTRRASSLQAAPSLQPRPSPVAEARQEPLSVVTPQQPPSSVVSASRPPRAVLPRRRRAPVRRPASARRLPTEMYAKGAIEEGEEEEEEEEEEDEDEDEELARAPAACCRPGQCAQVLASLSAEKTKGPTAFPDPRGDASSSSKAAARATAVADVHQGGRVATLLAAAAARPCAAVCGPALVAGLRTALRRPDAGVLAAKAPWRFKPADLPGAQARLVSEALVDPRRAGDWRLQVVVPVPEERMRAAWVAIHGKPAAAYTVAASLNAADRRRDALLAAGADLDFDAESPALVADVLLRASVPASAAFSALGGGGPLGILFEDRRHLVRGLQYRFDEDIVPARIPSAYPTQFERHRRMTVALDFDTADDGALAVVLDVGRFVPGFLDWARLDKLPPPTTCAAPRRRLGTNVRP